MSIPALLLALAIVGVLEPDLTSAMIAIGIVLRAAPVPRDAGGGAVDPRGDLRRGVAQRRRRPPAAIISGHVLPNVLSPLIVQMSLSMGVAILFEASISFLGLGVQPPDASWGSMLGRSTRFFEQSPYLVIVPGRRHPPHRAVLQRPRRRRSATPSGEEIRRVP